MNRDQVTRALREHEKELRAAGVLSASLSGSAARGEADPNGVDLQNRFLSYWAARWTWSKSRFVRRFQEEFDRDRALAFRKMPQRVRWRLGFTGDNKQTLIIKDSFK